VEGEDVSLRPPRHRAGKIEMRPGHGTLRSRHGPVGEFHSCVLDTLRRFREPPEILRGDCRVTFLTILFLILRQARELTHQGKKEILHTVEDFRVPALRIGGAGKTYGRVQLVDGAEGNETERSFPDAAAEHQIRPSVVAALRDDAHGGMGHASFAEIKPRMGIFLEIHRTRIESPRMDLSDFRKEYSARGLHREDLSDDPVEVFEKWFQQATELKVHEPNAMTLATLSPENMPSQRTVLLKAFDQKGFTFFTNYESRKAAHIATNPAVCLLFPWITLERQVIIQGRAEKISTAESLKYFATRPRESQIGAWVSNQSEIISSRKILIQKLDEIKAKFKGGEIPIPSFWGGYRVVPETIEFWQGGPARVHDRFLYTRKSGGDWKIDRLSP